MAGDRIANYVISVGGDASDLDSVFSSIKTKARGTVDEIKRITDRVELFGDLKNTIPQVERALDSAKAKVAQFTAELAKIESAGGKAPKTLTQGMADAERQVTAATRELARQQQQLATLDSQLARAGVNTKNLAAEQARLAQASKAASDAAALTAAKQQLGLVTLRDTQPEVAKLRAAYDALKSSGTLSASETAAAQAALSVKMKELEGTVTKTGLSFRSFDDAKTTLGDVKVSVLAVIAAVGAVVAALNSASNTAIAFNNDLAAIGTVTTLTKEQLEKLGASARALARDIGIDANDALKTLLEIIRSGVPAENSLEVLRRSADAAKASFTDVGAAAKTSSVLMDAFGVDAKDLSRALDIVVRSAQLGGPTLNEFGANAAQLGQITRATGADFREVTTLLNVMTASNGNAAESTATLTRVLVNLNNPEVGKKLRDLGIDSRSLVDIFRQLDARGLRLDEFLELGVVSAKGAAGLAALTNNAAAVPEKMAAIAQATGTVAEANAKLFDTQAERAKRYEAAQKDLEIQIGKTIGATGTWTVIMTSVNNAFARYLENAAPIVEADRQRELATTKAMLAAVGLGEATTKATKAEGEFHQALIDSAPLLVKAVEGASLYRKAIAELSADVLKQADALRTNAATQTDLVTKSAQLQIDTLDKGLKAQVATNEETNKLLLKAAAEKLALIQKSETDINRALQAAITARTAAASQDAEVQKRLITEIASLRQSTIAKSITDYQALYDTLRRQAEGLQTQLNSIAQERIALNERVAAAERSTRIAGLSDLGQYAEKSLEVDRLIAKGREVAATEGIAAAKRFFDQAGQIAESIKGEVKSGDLVVVTAFQSQQKALTETKKVATAYGEELDKAEQKAKEGSAATADALKPIEAKLRDLRAELAKINEEVAKGIRLEINNDIRGLGEAQAKIADLVKPETKVITIVTVQGNNGGGPITAGFNRGGHVAPWRQFTQAFADGGPVFRRPTWNKVPGVGNTDSQPALLSEGSFVMRKAASQKYGDALMSRLANFYADGGEVQKFADGGMAKQPVPSAIAQVMAYARRIINLARHPMFAIAVEDMSAKLFRLQGNRSFYEKVDIADSLLADARSVALNFALQDYFGKTALGTGSATFHKPLPDFKWREGTNVPPGLDGAGYAGDNKKREPVKSDDGFWNSGFWQHGLFTDKEYWKYQFADGGWARGTDKIRAMLTPGEWVIPRPAVDNIARLFGGGFLPSLNAMRAPAMPAPPRPQYLASGGMVGDWSPRSASRSTGPAIGNTYNVTINTPYPADDPRTLRLIKRGLADLDNRSS